MTDAVRPLDGLRFALVGAGAVGAALAGWIVERGGRATAVAARPGSQRAQELGRRLAAPVVPVVELASGDADLLLLAVPDRTLSAVAADLARRPQAPVALHVAGAFGASAIGSLAAAGSATGGFHPLRAFVSEDLPGTAGPPPGLFFALDGDPAAVALGRRLAAALGGVGAEIPEAARPSYHLVATLLAGGITTLAATAFEIRRRAGLPAAADAGYALLAIDALTRALAGGDPATGITGPAARGDLETFVGEARALAGVAPEALAIVVALGRESLRQRGRIAPLTPAGKRLAEALASPDLLDLARDRVLTSDPEPHG